MSLRRRCVVIDDDNDFLAFAGHALSRGFPEFEVKAFLGGVEALEFLAGTPVDLILTDFNLPFWDGLELTSAVRSFD